MTVFRTASLFHIYIEIFDYPVQHIAAAILKAGKLVGIAGNLTAMVAFVSLITELWYFDLSLTNLNGCYFVQIDGNFPMIGTGELADIVHGDTHPP